MELNAQQKKAVEYLDGPLLVLAGPGTGKTQLLSRKVEYILSHTDTNPENILCLTFTESGATNMRERLLTTIKSAAMKVNIGTYHSFGADILAEYKNYSETYDRRLDAVIDDVTKFKIIKNLQTKLPASDILRGDRIRDIISVISEAKSANLSSSDLAKIAEQNLADSAMLSQEVAPLFANLVPRRLEASLDNVYRPIYEVLQKYAEAEPILPSVERSAGIIARDLKDALVEAESNQKITPLSAWKDKYFEKDLHGNYRLSDRIANKKLASVAKIMESYQEYLIANGLLDFDDMIQEAVKALKTDAGFRATLQERYQFIMLDEFQDTNPAQLSIVQALTDYENPMIMAVGDDDQAIYEFQGALSSNLLDFQRHYSAHVIPLVENYRSTQEILDFSREIIQQAPERFADKELIAHQKAPKTSQIYRYEFLGADAEYTFIADQIAKLIAAGVPQKEIAVLSYKTKYFEPLLPYLKAHPEIKIAYEKRDNLFTDKHCHEIITTLTYVYELANEKRIDTPVMEILSYSWFKLPYIEIIRLVSQARRDKKSIFEVLGAAEIPEITEVAGFLANLAAKSFSEPLFTLMEPIIRRIDAEIIDPYERFQFYENLASLKASLKQHFNDQPLKLSHLIEFVNDYTIAEMPLSVKSPYRDAVDAVQIMTAHKAKGLEFKHVFVISADNTAWGKSGGNNNLLSLPRNLTQIRHTGITDGEKLRILYVAFTRAKQAIYITNSITDFSGKKSARLAYLKEYEDKDESGATVVYSPLIPSGRVITNYTFTPATVQDSIKNWFMDYVAGSPDMRSLYQERVNNFKMSASALTSFIDIIKAGPQSFFKSYILEAPRDPETEQLAHGTIMHTVFEKITTAGISDREALDLYLSELPKHDLPQEIIEKLRITGPQDLTIAINAFDHILRQGKAEVDFATDRLSINGIPVTGKIDHLIINEQAKTIEIYDFKASVYSTKKWDTDPRMYKYLLQLIFYKMLLNHSPRFARYKVEKAHILFVLPDRKDNQVAEREYTFNPTDEAKFMKLLAAVYHEIRSLDFLDDKDIFISADDNRKMQDLTAFIDLLLAKTGNVWYNSSRSPGSRPGFAIYWKGVKWLEVKVYGPGGVYLESHVFSTTESGYAEAATYIRSHLNAGHRVEGSGVDKVRAYYGSL